MERESRKTKKAVPPVTEKTPDPDGEKADKTLPEGSEDILATSESIPPQPFDLNSIDPKMIALANKFGIPLQPLMDWANSVEQRLALMQTQMPEVVKGAITEMVAEARQHQQAQLAKVQQMPGGLPMEGGGGLGGLVQFLPYVFGGGGVSEDMQKLQTDLVQMSISRMKADIGVADALKNAIISQLGGKVVNKVAQGL